MESRCAFGTGMPIFGLRDDMENRAFNTKTPIFRLGNDIWTCALTLAFGYTFGTGKPISELRDDIKSRPFTLSSLLYFFAPSFSSSLR